MSTAYLALALSGIIWGTPFLLAKLAAPHVSTSHMMLYRFAFATIGFIPFLMRRISLKRSDWMIVIAAGIIGVPVQFLLQFDGVARTTVAHASFMVGTAPVILAVAAFVLFRERLSRATWIALAASTAGVALVALKGQDSAAGSGPSLGGDLLVLISMFAGVTWILLSKRLMERQPPLLVTALVMVTGTIALALWVLWRDGPPPTSLPAGTWWALAAMGLAGTTCTTLLWNWGLAHVEAGRAGVFINLEPVVGAILGVLILHEQLGITAVVGGVLIVSSAVVVSLQDE